MQRDDVTSVVTWNPLLSEIEATPGSTKVFDSANIPGEIIDIMMVNTETLADNPDFGKALTGAWYEVMGLMAKPMKHRGARIHGRRVGTDLAGYQAQLDTTKMFFEPAEAVSLHQVGGAACDDEIRRRVPVRQGHSG
jgi:NitT/TauT family transport system substrate-binding protein